MGKVLGSTEKIMDEVLWTLINKGLKMVPLMQQEADGGLTGGSGDMKGQDSGVFFP